MPMKDPIITFALPRSGSTFLTRLLNKCSNATTGEKVKYNGECDILELFCPLINKIIEQDLYGIKSITELNEDKEFLSHYHLADTDDAINYLSNFWRMYCGGVNNWGWKNVNYGIKKDETFTNQIETLIQTYPQVKFILLDREINDVVKSMLQSQFWEGNQKNLLLRTQNQVANYQKILEKYPDRCFLLQYENLINYEGFLKFIKRLDWTISIADYNLIANNRRKDDTGTETEKIREMLKKA